MHFEHNGAKMEGAGVCGGGFSLVELLTATFITSLLLSSCLALFVQQQSTHMAERQKTEIRQNVGFAMDIVLRDIRMAGYGLLVPEPELGTWVNWIPGFHCNPQITDGANGAPDGLTVVAAFDAPVAELASGVTTGETVLAVRMLDPTPNLLDTYNRRILFLNKTETIRITHIAGSSTNLTLTISTHPTASSGIQNDYPAGSTLELVKAVRYDWHAANGTPGVDYPYLARQDEAALYMGMGMWEVSAAYIEDFQVAGQAGEYTVELTGIAPQIDRRYVHPQHQDHYRRRTAWAKARMRN